MRICVPTVDDQGLDSLPFAHFGSAPCFILHNTETGETVAVGNGDAGHQHGACSPLQAIGGQQVDAIIVGGIGGGAIQRLNAAGIRVYRAQEGTVGQNVEWLQGDALVEVTPADACRGHGGCGG